MTNVLQTMSNNSDLAELGELLGPPPVLSTEDPKAYAEILARFTQCFAPRDFMEQLWIKDLADSTWHIRRYRHHMTMAIERRVHRLREFDATRAQAIARQRDALSRRPVAGDGKPVTELARIDDLEDYFERSPDAVKEILDRPVAEREHARAFESIVKYYMHLTHLTNNAMAIRDNALEQLERYRRGWGRRLRQTSDEIIDAEFNEAPAS